MTNEMIDTVRKRIIEPVLRGMEHESKPYRGCLYVGLMITGEGPKVVEFNSRFGDPETQVVLPLFDQDLVGLLHSASTGTLSAGRETTSANSSGTAIRVILASGGYPDSYSTGKEIRGLDEIARSRDVMVFHAGTSRKEKRSSNGGRKGSGRYCLDS
jgi:phosphoribosylamine--glycine ligase